MRDTIKLDKIILVLCVSPCLHFLIFWRSLQSEAHIFQVLSFFLSLLHVALHQSMETPLVQETNFLFLLQLSKMASQTFFDGCQSLFHVGRWTPDQFCHVNTAPWKLIHK